MDHRCLQGHRVPAAFTFAIQNRMCPMCGNPTITEVGFDAAGLLAAKAAMDLPGAFSVIRVLESAFSLTAAGAPTAPAATAATPTPAPGAPAAPAAPTPALSQGIDSAAASRASAPKKAVAKLSTTTLVAQPPVGSASVSIAAATAVSTTMEEIDDVVVDDIGTDLPDPSAMATPEPAGLRVAVASGAGTQFAPEDENFFKVR